MTMSAVQIYEEQPSPILHIFPPDFPTTLSQYSNKARNMLSVDEYNETKWGR